MKFLFLNPVGELGGAERVLLHVLTALRRAVPDLELHLLVTAPGPLIEEARRHQVQATVLELPRVLATAGDSFLKGRSWLARGWDLTRRGVFGLPAAGRYLLALRRFVRELGPDLIHSNGIKTHLLVAALPGRLPPLVWHVHDFYSFRPVAARALRCASRRVAAAIAVSHAVAEDVRRTLPGVPVSVIHNVADLEEFTPGPGQPQLLDELAGLPAAVPGTIRVGLVATYARWKGQNVFLQAAAQLAREGTLPAVRFYVVGGPIYRTLGSQYTRAELRGLAETLGIADRVGFIDFQREPAEIYRALDIVVQASTRPEPFGLTIAEAMACGRPVIVARAGGAAELFRPDVDAVGVPPADPAALTAALHRLITDPCLRQRLSDQARHSAAVRFSSESLAPQLLAAYRMLGDRLPNVASSIYAK
jgi:glycosyltransferase involved in cell wall biosynthesis